VATYEVLKKDYVFQTLDKGAEVIICDFNALRMVDCNDLSVAAIKGFIVKPTAIFYKKVVTDE
jgi:hypothetical protein